MKIFETREAIQKEAMRLFLAYSDVLAEHVKDTVRRIPQEEIDGELWGEEAITHLVVESISDAGTTLAHGDRGD